MITSKSNLQETIKEFYDWLEFWYYDEEWQGDFNQYKATRDNLRTFKEYLNDREKPFKSGNY